MTTFEDSDALALLDFWLGAGPARWFARSDAFDAGRARALSPSGSGHGTGALAHWSRTASGSLALLVLLGTRSRATSFRGTRRQFETDPAALAEADRGPSRPATTGPTPCRYKEFLLPPPYQHAEDNGRAGTAGSTSNEGGRPGKPTYWALVHAGREIRRFGRFPHRKRAARPRDDRGGRGVPCERRLRGLRKPMSVWFRSQGDRGAGGGENSCPRPAHRADRRARRLPTAARRPGVLAGADPRTFAFLHAGMLWICGGSVFRQAVEDWPEGAPSGVAFEVAEVSRLYGFVVWRGAGGGCGLAHGEACPSAPGLHGPPRRRGRSAARRGRRRRAPCGGVPRRGGRGRRAMAEWLKPDRPTSDADLWDPLKAPRHFDLGLRVVFAVVASGERAFAPPAWDGPGVEADVLPASRARAGRAEEAPPPGRVPVPAVRTGHGSRR